MLAENLSIVLFSWAVLVSHSSLWFLHVLFSLNRIIHRSCLKVFEVVKTVHGSQDLQCVEHRTPLHELRVVNRTSYT